MARGFERPPLWAMIVMGAAVVACAVLIPVLLRGSDQPENTPAGEDVTAAPGAPTVAFLGDSYMAGSPEDSGEAARWPALVSAEQGWEPLYFAIGGTGFTTAGRQDTGNLFADRLPEIVAAAPDIVIVGGGANDAGASPAAFEAAVAKVLSGLAADLPDARLVVLSPFWREAPTRTILAERDILATQAAAVGATFIDVSGLFSEEHGIGSDGVHPTDAGHRRIADTLMPELPEV